MFNKSTKAGYIKLMPGVNKRTTVFGGKTLMAEFMLEKDNVLTEHTHPHEQTGYLVKGHIHLKIGDETYETLPGDSWCIPSDVKHSALIVEDSIAVEVFSPVREDFLPKK